MLLVCRELRVGSDELARDHRRSYATWRQCMPGLADGYLLTRKEAYNGLEEVMSMLLGRILHDSIYSMVI